MTLHTARRKLLAQRGRPMTLRRLLTTSTSSDVTVQGFLTAFNPEQVGVGDIRQGDAIIAICSDEITAALWPGPPRSRDQVVVDTRVWAIQGVTPLYDGADCVGYSLFVRGG